MVALLSDRSVVVSVAIALAVLALAVATSWRLPAWLVYLPAMAAGLAASELSTEPYRSGPQDVHPVLMATLVAGVAGVAGAAWWARTGDAVRNEIGLLVAGAGLGIFLCVPETGLLRVLFGPLLVAGVGSWLTRIRPFTAPEAVAVAAALAAVSSVDGQGREASIIGAAACLGAVGLLPLGRGGEDGPWGSRRRAVVAVLTVTILGCSRLAGVRSSTAVAAVTAVAILAGAALALRAVGRRPDLTTGRAPQRR